jgi:hypothetical protein
MRVGQTEFMDLSAAAQIVAPGALIVEEYQKEITDALRRNVVLDARIQYTPATGDFSTYFEQNTLNGGAFVDPRNPSATATSNLRTPHSLKVKAMTNQVNYGHYDLQLAAQQNNWPELQAKDLADMINAITITHGKALWRGTDTSLSTPTTLQYMGIAKQITNTFSVASGSSIVAAIRAKVAAMCADELYEIRPSAIYIHPIALNGIEEEERAATHNQTIVPGLSKTMVAGMEVRAIMTAAGLLPLIVEPFMTSAVNGTDNTKTDYGVAIVTEPMIEYHYVGDKGIFLFEMGLVSDLQKKFIGIKYGAPVAKGPSYAHSYGTITLTTVS